MTENFTKKLTPSFHSESFFLKTSFLSAFKWFLLIFFALAFSSVFFFLFICAFKKSNYDTLVSSQKKKLWTTKRPYPLRLISIGTWFMFILKRHLTLYVKRFGYKFAAMFVTFVCITYFTLQICMILPGTRSSSHEK